MIHRFNFAEKFLIVALVCGVLMMNYAFSMEDLEEEVVPPLQYGFSGVSRTDKKGFLIPCNVMFQPGYLVGVKKLMQELNPSMREELGGFLPARKGADVPDSSVAERLKTLEQSMRGIPNEEAISCHGGIWDLFAATVVDDDSQSSEKVSRVTKTDRRILKSIIEEVTALEAELRRFKFKDFKTNTISKSLLIRFKQTESDLKNCQSSLALSSLERKESESRLELVMDALGSIKVDYNASMPSCESWCELDRDDFVIPAAPHNTPQQVARSGGDVPIIEDDSVQGNHGKVFVSSITPSSDGIEDEF